MSNFDETRLQIRDLMLRMLRTDEQVRAESYNRYKVYFTGDDLAELHELAAKEYANMECNVAWMFIKYEYDEPPDFGTAEFLDWQDSEDAMIIHIKGCPECQNHGFDVEHTLKDRARWRKLESGATLSEVLAKRAGVEYKTSSE